MLRSMQTNSHQSKWISSKWRRLWFPLVVGLIVLGWSVTTWPVYAATLTVDTLTDENDGSCSDGDCSLRDAIAVTSNGDTINFAAALSGGTITLDGTQLTIDKNVTIIANVPIIVSADSASRVFEIALNATVTIDGLTIRDGHINGGQGGGIYNLGTLTLNNSTVSDNSVSNSTSKGAGGNGGGIYNSGMLTVSNSVVSNNSANGANAPTDTLDNIAGGKGGTGGIYSDGTLSISDSTFHGNAANGGSAHRRANGGAGGSGGINNAGTLTVNSSTIRNNSADGGKGGAINSADQRRGGKGGSGGIHNSGMATVSTSTISNNSADGGARANSSVGHGGHGGNGSVTNSGTLTLTSSTISDNNALGRPGGTSAGNDGNDGNGIRNSDTLTLRNTIVANSTAVECDNADGATLSVTHSLIEDGSCGAEDGNANNNLSGDPQLASLAGNGGRTQTHALLAGSPAIDAGNNANCPATDQRGNARPQADTCDIGAVEFTAPTDCTAAPWNVASAGLLNIAIACYNAATASGTHTINFTDDITLTAALPTINNTTANVALHIDGDGHALDGQDSVRAFNIATNTTVSIDALWIRNGFANGGSGGAIVSRGLLTIDNSTLSNNEATVAGGAIRVVNGTTTLRNNTVSGNTANDTGGVRVNAAGTFHSINSTFIDNQSGGSNDRGDNIDSYGTMTLVNSLFATSGDRPDTQDCRNRGTRMGNNNFVGDGTCSADVSGDPMVGPLQDNGGSTPTHALLLGSPALDAANNADCPAADQRGESRPIDGTGNGTATCDIGAFESQTTPTFNLDTHSPTANALNVPLTSDVTATFDADVAANSVVSTSFAAHTQFSGLITGTLSTSDNTVTLNPNRDLFMGEQVQVIATEQLNSVAGKSLTIPTQWGFTVGNSSQRCATFVEADAISAVLLGVYDSSVAWGDYDNDGKLDILLTGWDGSGRVSAVYKNEGGGVFSNATTISDVLTDVSDGSVAWGDYDNDGDLDILLNGNNSGSNRISRVYENEGSGVFSNATATSDALIDAYNGGVAWGDHDNDGDLDILLTGSSALGNISRVYENEGSGVFNNETAISDVLTNVNGSSVAWGDYDNDGDLDILMTGWTGSGGVSEVYKNEGILGFSKATTISDALTNVYASRVAWGDYDNDGDLDILLTGSLSGVPVSEVYENEGGGVFSKEITISNALTDVRGGDIAWGDYDNDGDLDILLTGTNNVAARVSELYENEGGGVFSKATAISNVLTGVYDSSVAWGDYDNDGDLDILLTGRDSSSDPVSRVYRNDDCTPELTVEKTASAATVEVGDTVTYTVVVANSGLSSATGAVISDTLPSGLTFVANSTMLEPADAGTTGDAPTLVSGLTITGGTSVTVTYQAMVDAGTEFETLVNTVGVTDAEGSDESDTASVTVLCSESLFPFAVDSAENLDKAIRCFNSFSTPDTYTISLTNNISLTTELTTIDNSATDLFLTIDGNGHALDGQNSVRLFTIHPGAPVQIDGLTMMNGSAYSGGAIENSGTLTVENSTLVGNQATNGGGAITNYGQLTVRNSTISGNSAATDGGGINSQNQATIENSTIANNTANSGAGIYNLLDISLVNSIVADNNGTDCEQNTPITSLGHNLDSDGSCLDGSVMGDQPNTDPLLGSLADNGGSTQTHALLHNSPAIDRTNVASCTGTDQRGEARDADHNCDIGAFELQFADSPTVVRDDVPADTERTFGPTLAKVMWRTTDPGTLSITKIVTETEDDETFDLIWTVNADNNSGLDLDITFCYLETEIPPAIAGSEAALMLYKQPSSGGAFTALSTTVDEANNCVTATVDGFSNFGIGLAAPTAVELDYFSATANEDGSVTVDWATASEVNHAGFNLYRRPANSRDDWTAINAQLIASRGTQAQGAEYQFVEQGVADGRWEYLLEDVENDGDVYRHLDAIETVVIGNPTAVTLTTRTAVGGSALGFVAQFIGLLLITVGAVVRSGRGDEEAGDRTVSLQMAERFGAVVGVAPANRAAFVAFARGISELPFPASQLGAAVGITHNIPYLLTPIYGRERERILVTSRLQQGWRLLTLVGLPGIGKTETRIKRGQRSTYQAIGTVKICKTPMTLTYYRY